MDLDSLWAVLVHFNPKQTYRVMAAPSKCFSNTSLDSNRYEAWKDRRSSICWYFMIYVNNLRARNRGTDDTLRKLYLYISCNNIYRVPRKKKKRKRKTYSVIIRLMYKIMFSNSRPNQRHWTWCDTKRQCTLHCEYSECYLLVMYHLVRWELCWLIDKQIYLI